MSQYLKPQEPLQINGDYIYPVTTIDQVISKNGQTRLDNDVIVKSTDILSLEEIEASTELNGKVPSAEALKSVNSKNTWKFLNQVTGNNYISFPDDFSEIHIYVYCPSPYIGYEFTIPNIIDSYSGGYRSMSQGYYFNDGNHLARIEVDYENKRFRTTVLWVTGQDKLSTTVTVAHYK